MEMKSTEGNIPISPTIDTSVCSDRKVNLNFSVDRLLGIEWGKMGSFDKKDDLIFGDVCKSENNNNEFHSEDFSSCTNDCCKSYQTPILAPLNLNLDGLKESSNKNCGLEMMPIIKPLPIRAINSSATAAANERVISMQQNSEYCSNISNLLKYQLLFPQVATTSSCLSSSSPFCSSTSASTPLKNSLYIGNNLKLMQSFSSSGHCLQNFYHNFVNPETRFAFSSNVMKGNGMCNIRNNNASSHNNNNNNNSNNLGNSSANNSNNNNNNNNNSNNGNATGGNKRKRSWSRAVFSNLQRKGLEIQFQQQKYITKPDRRKLAARLNLTDAQVKVWFQNRRMKWRHTRENLKSGQEKSVNNAKKKDFSHNEMEKESSSEDEIDVVKD